MKIEITKEEYEKILKKEKIGELMLYIDTSQFRVFFTEIDNTKVKELIGESLITESTIIKFVMFVLEPISLLTTLMASIFLFKWFALLAVPAIILLWGFLKGQASIGKQKIHYAIMMVIISVIFLLVSHESSQWLKIFLLGISFTYFSSKLLYYLTARFGFKLIHRNYSFFKLFYEKPEGTMVPMIWSDKVPNDADQVKNTPQPFNPKDKQKKDFGIYMKGVITNPDTSIHIVDPFTICNLVLYSDHSSSITGKIDKMLVTFDFDDSILKVFIYALSKLGLITKTDLNQRLREQSDEPIVYDFSRNGVLVTGVVLECKLGETAKSETTNEAFIPLTIKIAKIVQEPAAILIDTNNHG